MKVGALLIDEREIVETFVRASGPGGQNVKKGASAVELRFDARRSPSLPDDVAARLIKLAMAVRKRGGRQASFETVASAPPFETPGDGRVESRCVGWFFASRSVTHWKQSNHGR
jgi:hypothetical protein